MKRHYIRHPTAIPLDFELGGSEQTCAAKDITEGGVCFVSSQPLHIGQHIHITIQYCEPRFSANGVVKWCTEDGDVYLVGVAFEDASVKYALRMVEQVCYIEDYRNQIKREQGIDLSSEQAARQWIQKYAANFPSITPK
ncbi:MAG: PilZ domain-containing protein [Gammaproteobacteria bacterium]|nr:PilZ domain-containing protein [Gammaproteobacteria bacterium]